MLRLYVKLWRVLLSMKLSYKESKSTISYVLLNVNMSRGDSIILLRKRGLVDSVLAY